MARTALQIVQDGCTKLGIEQPRILFADTDRTAVELRQALIEAADKIVRAHDWQVLRKLNTDTGDGSTTEYPLPAEYLRMPKGAEVWSTRWQHPLLRISPEDWLNFDVRDYDVTIGSWTIYGGNIVYKPALASGESAKWWYVSRNKCADSGGTAKETFSADDDTFRLDDRVLELVFVWTWRQQKGLDYGEDMATAEIALARAISDDSGARIITQASRGDSSDARVAYPRQVVP